MLSADDLALVARHPALPGLGMALDPTVVAELAAAALPSLGIKSAFATYVRFKPPSSCLVGYRFTLRRGEVDGYVRTGAAADPKLVKAVAVARQRVDGQPSAALLDERTALLLHPSDHDLPVLARLHDAELRRGILARALDVDPADGWQLRRLRYKPERRWVGLLTDVTGHRLLLKVHRRDQHRHAVDGARLFERSGVPVSRLVGSSDRHRLTVHQWVDGTSAEEDLAAGGPAALGAAAAVGALLAQVHSLPAPPPRRRAGAPDEVGALGTGVAALRLLDPSAGARAGRISGQLTDLLPATDGQATTPRLLHGDCSVDQVVLGADGPVLIDVDRATLGDVHSDLGQLLADLVMRQVTGVLADDRPYACAVLGGYRSTGAVIDRRRLTACTSARLLRLASEPFRRRRHRWAEEMHTMVERAAALASDGLLV